MGKLANIPGANLVPKINAAHRAAFGHAKEAMEAAAECGRLLLQAKELVPHGDWVAWLEANTETDERQSQKYMRLAKHWPELEKRTGGSYLGGINETLKLIAKPKPINDDEERDRKECVALYQKVCEAEREASEAGERPNTGCNYDPADPRGWYKDEDTKIVRRRAWLNMASSAMEMADSFLAKGGHRAIAVADAEEIDRELIDAALDAANAWRKVANKLAAIFNQQASTLPQDGRSGVAVDDPTPSSVLFAELETELKNRGAAQ
jgi:hypothetical protein